MGSLVVTIVALGVGLGIGFALGARHGMSQDPLRRLLEKRDASLHREHWAMLRQALLRFVRSRYSCDEGPAHQILA